MPGNLHAMSHWRNSTPVLSASSSGRGISYTFVTAAFERQIVTYKPRSILLWIGGNDLDSSTVTSKQKPWQFLMCFIGMFAIWLTLPRPYSVTGFTWTKTDLTNCSIAFVEWLSVLTLEFIQELVLISIYVYSDWTVEKMCPYIVFQCTWII